MAKISPTHLNGFIKINTIEGAQHNSIYFTFLVKQNSFLFCLNSIRNTCKMVIENKQKRSDD